MSDNIPFEIQAEIMKKLPVKSLVQFRTVSKAWKSLIDSSQFIVEYSGRHTQEHLLVRYSHKFEQKYVSIVDDHTFPEQKVSPTIPPPVNMLNYASIIGISHGLLCLYYNYQEGLGGPCSVTNMAFLWNLSIRKVVAVAVPNVGCGMYETVLGFGVCRETIEPKIVKVTHIKRFSDMESISCIPWQVEIFTLNTGAWRTPYSTNLPFNKSIEFNYFTVTVDGFIYWLVIERNTMDGVFSSCNLIISFDMTSEEFREVNLPDSIAHQFYINLSMSKRNESLVVLEFSGDPNQLVYYVWMMEDGVSNLFTKLFTIDFLTPDGFGCLVRGFRKTGEPIVESLQNENDSNGQLAVYEPYSKSLNNLGINGMGCSCFVYPYMETLLLLDQPNFITFDKGKRYIQSEEVRHKAFEAYMQVRRTLEDYYSSLEM
ncbi:putative F-box domain-containing protein [Helianthus annuus]|nr:putative F-box domain-containing protein [Helianthus annuus]